MIVFPIFGTSDETAACETAVAALAEAEYDGVKTFVCVSTCLTWARTTSEDEEPVFTEEEFRRRKAHPNFKHYQATEKLVTRSRKKESLRTYIVCAGLTYGLDEWLLHPWFRDAWNLVQPGLDVYGEGENVVPMIHVNDLAAIVAQVARTPPEQRYLLAVDDSRNTLREIVEAINNELGTGGKLNVLSKDEYALLKDIEIFLVDLRLEAGAVKEMEDLEWHCADGLVDRVGDMVGEFREARNLTPLKICLHGPPSSGKTHHAERLAAHYKIHHIKTKDVIDEALAAADEDAREELQAAMEENGGRLSDDVLIPLFINKLRQKPYINQGYVLDCFPKTTDQAQALFDEEADFELTEDEIELQVKPVLRPEYVVSFDATDEFLAERVMSMDQKDVEGTHNDEDGFRRRLTEWREANTEVNTVINFYEESDIDPLVIAVDEEEDIHARILKYVGSPHNYGPSEEEEEERLRAEKEKKDAERELARKEQEIAEQEERERKSKRDAREMERLNEIRRMEESSLDTHALPLRRYLLENVMPEVTNGLLLICKLRPADPLSYLASHLFSVSPEVESPEPQ